MQATSGQPGTKTGAGHALAPGSAALLPPAPRALPAGPPPLEVELAEQHRWVRLLAIPFCIAAVFFAATVATGHAWLLGPAIVLGPILMMGLFIYLMLSSEANSESAAATAATAWVGQRQRPRRQHAGGPARAAAAGRRGR
jgi:hypothetical protein